MDLFQLPSLQKYGVFLQILMPYVRFHFCPWRIFHSAMFQQFFNSFFSLMLVKHYFTVFNGVEQIFVDVKLKHFASVRIGLLKLIINHDNCHFMS